MEAVVSRDIMQAVWAGSIPEIEWLHGDDLCDCTFQRIGLWKNPYLAETLEIRLCCVWAELAKQYPDLVRTIPGYFNENTGQWITQPMQWDGEADMPVALWHRQLAKVEGISLAEARSLSLPVPEGQPHIHSTFWMKVDGEWLPGELGS